MISSAIDEDFLCQMKLKIEVLIGIPLIRDEDLSKKTNFFMGYHLRDQKIVYILGNLRKNKEQIEKMKNVSDHDFFEIALYHEVGHHFDYLRNPSRKEHRLKNDEVDKEFSLQGEINAYNLGREIVPIHLLLHYDNLNLYNISVYTN